MSAPTPMDALTTPLAGRHLIEASAGTGKTFTLAALYLRLVLGHDPGDPDRAPLLPPEILVMTFTRDATRELRERIRSRLADAALCFAGVQAPEPGDAILTGLLDAYPDPAQRERHANHLRAAADWMDEAAIYTIDSFCQRMLRQHAFDSGHAFDFELAADESDMTREAIEDYWREHIYPLDDTELLALNIAIAGTKGPSSLSVVQLARTLRPLIGRSDRLADDPDDSPKRLLEPHAQALQSTIDALRRALGPNGEGLERLDAALREAWDKKRLDRRRKPTAAKWEKQFRAPLAQWRQHAPPGLPPVDLAALSSAALSDACLGDKPLPESLREHPIVKAVDALMPLQEAMRELARPFYAHALRWVDERLAQTRRKRGVFGFKDMLLRLRDALQAPDGGARLARVIRRQFPVALVDEFQDTDPVQYAILQAIYIDPADPPPYEGTASLFLIGDPKQAIYSFRGADLATYLKAARDVPAGHCHTLSRNYRSSRAMVDAINALYAHSPLKPHQFLQEGITYHPIDANGSSQRFELEGAEVPALTLAYLDPEDDGSGAKSLPLVQYREQMAEIAAARIRDLLARGRDGQAGFRGDAGFTPLAPAHIAVLVRTGKEATLIRNALRRRGLASVYLSDRDNVLQTQEAQDILHWLQAMAEPESERRVRTALGTASLGWDWASLDALFSDDARWEAALEQFHDYAELWQRRGILPALRRLLHDQAVAPHLLGQPGGERRLTNLLQISELLQEAAATLDGPASLIRWLADAREGTADDTTEESVLRLESDSALIKVITLHKSKGLEYPLVFLPFVCNFRSQPMPTPWLRPETDHPGATLQIRLEASNEDRKAADHARLAEDMRLLYVGITRAVHACWLGTAAVRETNNERNARKVHLHRSAIGRLLGCPEDLTPDGAGERFRQLARCSEHITLERVTLPSDAGDATTPPVHHPAMARARTYRAHPPNSERWWIASYSALVEQGPRGWTPGTAEEDVLAQETLGSADVGPADQGETRQATRSEQTVDDSLDATTGETDAHAIPTIPRGPATGTLLHRLLESLAARQFPRVGEAAFEQVINRSLRGGRWRAWRAPIADWLGRISEASLPLPASPPLRLTDLGPQDFLAELEFLISVSEVDAYAIDQVIRQHTLGGIGRPALGESALNGMVKGYIDLVFIHDGRYWVLDYKSNDLGDSAADYAAGALRQEVMAKRYDAQYALYLLALHRLLRARLGRDYDYDRHVGGAACLFLRGIEHPGAGLHAERPERALVESLDALFGGADCRSEGAAAVDPRHRPTEVAHDR